MVKLISPCDVNEGDIVQSRKWPVYSFTSGENYGREIIDDPDHKYPWGGLGQYPRWFRSNGVVLALSPILILKAYRRLNRGFYVFQALIPDGTVAFVGFKPGKRNGEHSFSLERLITHA